MSYNYGSHRPTVTPASASTADISKDVQLSSPPEDSISDLSWSKGANLLAVASWDKKLRIYDVSENASGVGKAMIDFEGPVLSCDWSEVKTQLPFSLYQTNIVYRMDIKL